MKKTVIYIFAFIVYVSNCFAGGVKVTPISINFKGAVAQKNNIVAFADYGSALISYDNAESWQQKRIFKDGTIVNLFIHDDEFTAFNDRGEIAVSNNTGKDWSFVGNLGDSVLCAIEYPTGYLVRTRHKLATLTDDYKIINEFDIDSPPIKEISQYFNPDYSHSLSYKSDKFVAEFDSSVFIGFDTQLNPTDTLNLLDHVDSAKSLYGGAYRIFNDSDYFYLSYKYSKDKLLKKMIYRTMDLSSVEIYSDSLDFNIMNYVDDNKYYSLTRSSDNIIIKDTTKLSYRNIIIYINDFIVSEDRQIVFGDKKILKIMNLKDSSVNVVSDYSRYSTRYSPEQINDSTFLIYSSGPAVYKTPDNFITILPTVEKNDHNDSKFFERFSINHRYFDKEEKELYLLGQFSLDNRAFIWKSKDIAKNFDSVFSGFRYRSNMPLLRNTLVKNNIQKRGDEFICSDGFNYIAHLDTVFSSIETFNKNGGSIKFLSLRNAAVTNVYSKDTNTYLVHCCDMLDSTSMIMFTSDGGIKWDTVHKYPINETISDIYEIEVKGREYFVLYHVDFTKYPENNGKYLDVVDKETNQFSRIAQWEPNPDIEDDGSYGVAVTSSEGVAYISYNDSLFVTEDLFNKKNWNYYILPGNGRVVRPLIKIGNAFICNYNDKNNPYGKTLYKIELQDSLIISVDDIEERDYFYAFPPYPMPAKNIVRSLIYFDNNVLAEDVEVFDRFGVKVGDGKDISIDKVKSYSAILSWNCSGVATGVYFIRVRNGDRMKILKVIVKK
ncbi:MAG: T9SS type A sorting domain-containing protein [Chlorobi bacterium]|nr:T9SS type A sorting domain-containing protein [Chlorobiota bacterium]